MNFFTIKSGIRLSLVLGTTVLATALSATSASAQAIRAGYDSLTLAANDDGFVSPVNMGFSIDFFGSSFSDLSVNNNGNVTFGGTNGTYTPTGLTGATGRKTISPFWADVDTRRAGSGLTKYGTGTYTVGLNNLNAFGVTWVDVAYFKTNGVPTSVGDKLNSFQMIIVNRTDISANTWDIEFNYDKIQWEAGTASDGVEGLGGTSARAGYSAGTGVPGSFYEFPTSGVDGSFLDSNLTTGLIHNSLNSNGVLGRYTFRVNGGTPEILSSSAAPEPGTLALLGLGGVAVLLKRRRK